MKSLKRALSLLMALLLILTVLPAEALAAGARTPENPEPAAAPTVNDTQGNYNFTTQPQGGNVVPDGSYTLSWATDFTPLKVQIGYLKTSSVSNTFCSVKELYGSETSYALPYDSVVGNTSWDWYVRAYYNDSEYVASYSFRRPRRSCFMSVRPS